MEHVLGSGKPNAFGSGRPGGGGRTGCICIGPYPESAHLVSPLEEPIQIRGSRWLANRQFTCEDCTADSIDGDNVTNRQHRPGKTYRVVVHHNIGETGHRRSPGASCRDGSVRCPTTVARNQTRGRDNSIEVPWQYLPDCENRAVTAFGCSNGSFSREDQSTGSRTWRRWGAYRYRLHCWCAVEARVQHARKLFGIHPVQCLVPADYSLIHQIDSATNRRLDRPIGGAGFDHPEASSLPHEIKTHHVAPNGLEPKRHSKYRSMCVCAGFKEINEARITSLRPGPAHAVCVKTGDSGRSIAGVAAICNACSRIERRFAKDHWMHNDAHAIVIGNLVTATETPCLPSVP